MSTEAERLANELGIRDDGHDHERTPVSGPLEVDAELFPVLDRWRKWFGVRREPLDMAYGVPVCGFTGVNGAGKTALAVESAIAAMKAGRDVYSTVPIHSPYGDSKPILSLRHILSLRSCLIVLDEAAVIFSSRSTASLPAEVVVRLQTLRHDDVTVIWTAPAWMRIDNLLREVTQGLVNVVPMSKVKDGTPWPRPRFVGAGLMDTSIGKTDAEPTKRLKTRFARLSRLHSVGAYDTHADTPLLGRRHVGGRCVDCGGTVEVPKHSKARHEALGIPWFEGDAFSQIAEQTARAGALPTFREISV